MNGKIPALIGAGPTGWAKISMGLQFHALRPAQMSRKRSDKFGLTAQTGFWLGLKSKPTDSFNFCHVLQIQDDLWYDNLCTGIDVIPLMFAHELEARLGNSGLKVSKLILGCMSYGSPKWQEWVLSGEEGIKHIKAAYDAGINAFDTANVYSNGLSEIILGKAIKQHNLPREEIVVMTKVYFTVGKTPDFVTMSKSTNELDSAGYVNQRGLGRKASPNWLAPLYIIGHRFDYETPIEETVNDIPLLHAVYLKDQQMQALHDVVKAGYVRYIGMSSCWGYQFNAMQTYAIQNNLTPFISMQNHYSMVYREEEREMFPTLKHFGVGSIPWSPLARGLLSRPLDQKTKRGQSDRMITGHTTVDATATIVNRVEEIAKKKNAKMAQIAIAWVMAKDGVTAPIIGTTSLENLSELIDAVDIELSEDEVKYLEEPYKPRAIMGHL
ncbi:hypothetical protein D9757_011046 [Collybiopsis confluens]|uniref:NADP-dependent oxidoreductase domain-containing protein n=1 Tax=Collybiopsis confluens TaxID=2823264 RepID=A0A8H5GJ55_9AGAR|nr:hypothetical protein D9757_011046 [Collybiopsis confluens]